MKKLTLSAVCMLTFSTGLFANEISISNFNVTSEENISEPFKVIRINRTIRDVDGNVYQIRGTVDISIGFDGITINSYDIVVTCGENSWHFVGKIHSEQNSNGSVSNRIYGTLIDQSNNNIIPISDSIKDVLIKLNNSI